jgi:transcriptional regulator with XRE-family HTH domain
MGRRARIIISDFVAQIGARVRVLRFERGLSIRALAELAGCSPHGIMQIELGYSAMTIGTIHKLALALHVEPFDILNHDTQTSHLGWLLETMRHDANVLSVIRAKLAPRRRTRAARARS